ncbi:MAG TPA: FHA domain-containing protein, partial [Anaerolineales bacterium]|nr:FHA domain-containing protein [Anaerolineales bacterium]
MATQSFQLVMRAGPSIGKVFPINKGEMHIGRDISNEIVINDAEVSRKHVRIVIQAGEVIIEDLGSTNGTFVNEQRLSGPYTLVAGDTLQLGEHVLLVFEAAL